MLRIIAIVFVATLPFTATANAQNSVGPDDKIAFKNVKKMTIRNGSIAGCATGLKACTGAGYMVCCAGNCGHTPAGLPYCY
jgi:hypothetical protein